MYRVQRGPGFRKAQLPHTSMVVKSTKWKKSPNTPFSVLSGRESCTLVALGHKVYQGSMLACHIQFYQLYIGMFLSDLAKELRGFSMETTSAISMPSRSLLESVPSSSRGSVRLL